jgi:signal transduction histidine kinase
MYIYLSRDFPEVAPMKESSSPAVGGAAPRGGAPSFNRRFLTTAFARRCAGAVLATAFALFQARRLEADARDEIVHGIARGRVVRRIAIEVEARRILIDDHIFTKDVREMSDLEGKIAGINARITSLLSSYAVWGDFRDARPTWDRTRVDLAALDAPITSALALSRANRDSEARQMMNGVSARFVQVRQDLEDLVALSDRAAQVSFARLASMRTWLTLTLLTLGLAGVVGTILVGRWAARILAARQAEAARYARDLEARNRELDAFAGRVAHDIRGALTTISLAATSSAASALSDERAREILRRGTRRMETLVDDLLTLARVEAEGHGRCDPAVVLAQVAEDMGPRVEAERADLRVAVAHAQVACSEGLLRQAMTNLIDNAVKYRRPDLPAAVEISGASSDGGYDLRVSDNGVGMTDEELGHVLEPFYRAPRARDLPGTGLGLSIVNRIAEANGGNVTVRSRVGEGTTFTVHLPLAAAPAREEAGGRP